MRQRAIHLIVLLLLLSASLATCGAAQPSPAERTPTASQAGDEHFRKGNELAEQGKFEDAIEEYQKALEEDPNNVSAMVNMGVAYYNSGQLADAVDMYKQALEIAPSDADIHSNLGAAYVQQENLQSGLTEYQRAVELDPALAQAHFGLGVIYKSLDQKDEAIAAFKKYIELDQGQDAYATGLAQQYLEQLEGQ